MNRLALLALCLAACAPPPDHWTIKGPAPTGVEIAVEVVREMAPCDLTPWGGQALYVPDRFYCGYTLAMGCAWPSEDRVEVVTAPLVTSTSTVHELAHLAFERCGLTSDSDRHTWAFLGFVIRANEELRRRMEAR